VDRGARVGALGVLAGLALGATALTQGTVRIAFLTVAGLMVPGLVQALRNRVGPITYFRYLWHRFERRSRALPGWRAGHVLTTIGPYLIAKGPNAVTGFLCVIEGPGGRFEANDPEPGRTDGEFQFPQAFENEQGNRPPSHRLLPRGVYFQYWWAYDQDRQLYFVAMAPLVLYPSGKWHGQWREKLWKKLLGL
jgi:hypothetical protein